MTATTDTTGQMNQPTIENYDRDAFDPYLNEMDWFIIQFTADDGATAPELKEAYEEITGREYVRTSFSARLSRMHNMEPAIVRRRTRGYYQLTDYGEEIAEAIARKQ